MKMNITVKMKAFSIAVLTTAFAMGAFAQVGTAVKETGKATAESAKEAGDNVKGAMSSYCLALPVHLEHP